MILVFIKQGYVFLKFRRRRLISREETPSQRLQKAPKFWELFSHSSSSFQHHTQHREHRMILHRTQQMKVYILLLTLSIHNI